MSRIKNLVDAGFITRTGLVDSEIAEAWTITQMFLNGTITKTGLNPNDLEKIADGGGGTLPDPIIGQELYDMSTDSFYIPVQLNAPAPKNVLIRWTWKSSNGEYAEWTPALDEDGTIKTVDINNGNPGGYTIKAQAYLEDEETQEIIYGNEVEEYVGIFVVAPPVVVQAKPGDPVTFYNPMYEANKTKYGGMMISWTGGDQGDSTTYYMDNPTPLTLEDLDHTGQGGTFTITADARVRINGVGNMKYSKNIKQEVSF